MIFYHSFKDWSEVHRWFIRGYVSQVLSDILHPPFHPLILMFI